jgi:DUF2934 family protein
MDRRTQLRSLEHQLDLANRAVRLVIDDVTVERLRRFAHDVECQLADARAALAEEETRARAHELWREAGCPPGRDLEFWLRAERERDMKRLRELV